MVIAILLLVWVGVNANNSDTTCEWTALELNEKLILDEKIRGQLVTGFWMDNSTKKEEKVILQFHSSGRLDWIASSFEHKTSYQYGIWDIDFSNKNPVLIWENDNSKQYFEIKRTCEGLTLKNRANKQFFSLKHQPQKDDSIIKNTTSEIIGHWGNATYPFDLTTSKNRGTKKTMKGAYLKVNFAEDGTFIQKYGNAKTDLIQYGRWELSKDGQFIFLHCNEKTSIAKIEYLNMDELVLELQLNCNKKTAFSTKQKSFVFIR